MTQKQYHEGKRVLQALKCYYIVNASFISSHQAARKWSPGNVLIEWTLPCRGMKDVCQWRVIGLTSSARFCRASIRDLRSRAWYLVRSRSAHSLNCDHVMQGSFRGNDSSSHLQKILIRLG